jgi:hypothetical protein
VKTKLLLAVSLVVFIALPSLARAADQIQSRPLPRDASGANTGADYKPAGRASSQSFAHYWHIETVDSEGGEHASLALDRAGRPHIGYLTFSTNDNEYTLKYAWHNGTNWNLESVGVTGYVNGGLSLALNGADMPCISYFYDFRLGYAWNDSTGWHTGVVDNEVINGSRSSLALDQAGRPHISYYRSDPPVGVKYAWHDGTRWNFAMVESGDTSWNTSLALDGMGRPHISYHDNSYDTAGLRYAWHDGAEWHTETVDDSVGYVTGASSLALDESNRPHISYYCDNSSSIKYAWHDGVEWYIETVDETGISYEDSSLKLDGAGRPHIGYHSHIGGSLKYAWHDGTDWRIETVVSVGNSEFVSLALDGDDQPHLSYQSYSELKYAYPAPPPPLFLNKRATPGDGLRNNGVLTYTLTLSGSDLNVRLWDPLPEAVNYVADSLISSLEPTPFYSPASRAINWEGALPSSDVATLQFQVTPGITGTGSADLSQTIVNTAWLTDTTYGTSVSATAIINGEHIYLPLVLRLH